MSSRGPLVLSEVEGAGGLGAMRAQTHRQLPVDT